MPHIGGGFLLLVVLSAFIIWIACCLRGRWQQLVHQDHSPLQKAKRKWCKAREGSVEKNEAEELWDKLTKEELDKATTLCELYNCRERVLTYSFHGMCCKRTSEVIDAYYEDKRDNLIDQIEKEKAKHAEELRKAMLKGQHAPHPKKLPGAGRNTYINTRG